jgi:hypothetical protein
MARTGRRPDVRVLASPGGDWPDVMLYIGLAGTTWSGTAVSSRFQQGWEDRQGPARAYLDTDLLTRAMEGEQMEIPPAGIAAYLGLYVRPLRFVCAGARLH